MHPWFMLPRRRTGAAWFLILFALCLSLFAAPVVSATGATYYVAPSGADSNDGLTLATPFATIQKCASVATAGDTCLIRGGTYRETVTVPRSGSAGNPITFKAYNAETVTLSGADVLTAAWTQHSGRIYRTTLPWNLDIRDANQVTDNQIFLDGQMLPAARWPNISPEDVTHLQNSHKARADGATRLNASAAIYQDADLAPFAAGAWTGARISFGPGWGIINTTCDVTDSTAASVSFQCNPDPGADNQRAEWGAAGSLYAPAAGNYYYLWGSLAALDAPGEWFRAADGTLYLWTLDGSPPAGHTVEAKRRLYAFDLSGRSHITLDGLHITAATIKTDLSANHLTLQNLDLRYLWHFQQIPPFHSRAGIYGVELRGDDSVLRDSTLAYSAGEMILLSGRRNQALNNVVWDAGYMGGAAAVSGQTWTQSNAGGADSNDLRQNTIFNTGRFPVQADPGLNVTYNDLYNSHLQIMDLGVIYAWGSDGKGAHIAYNLVHDNWAELDGDQNFFGGFGIYLDDDTYNYEVYRNVVWNTTSDGLYAVGTNGTVVQYPAGMPSNRRFYNNTVDGRIGAVDKRAYNGIPQTLLGTEFVNNTAVSTYFTSPDLVHHHNLIGDALYVDPAAPDYRLRSYSPARDAAVDLGSPYMDSPMQPVGAPDAGALEHGRTPWVAGATLRPPDLAGLAAACTANADGQTAVCTLTNLPIGRRLPAGFEIRFGSGAPAADCGSQMDYAAHHATATCTGSTAGLNGTQPVFVRLPGGSWVDTGASVDLGPLAVHAVSPGSGFPTGGTRVTLSGRRFSTAAGGYERPLTLNNPSGSALYNYQLPIHLDTASLIAAGKLRADCGDLRVHDAYGPLDYWLERGCNTASTRLWVEVTHLPAGSSSLTLTYGDPALASASSGADTFFFFDDFGDGALDDTYWTLGAGHGTFYTVSEAGGQLVLSGQTAANTRDAQATVQLNTWHIAAPAGFAIDSEMSVVSGPDNFKATPGTLLAMQGDPGGTPAGKDIAYWAGGWQVVGSSTVSAGTFTRHRFSIGFSGPAGGRTVRWFENGDTAVPLATYSTTNDNGLGSFSYGPDAVAAFEARFDNVRVRQFVFPEPTAGVGAERAAGVIVTFGGAACTAVTPIDGTRLTCITPPHPNGAVDVTLTNPDGQSATLPGGFVYVEPSARVFLPSVRRPTP